MKIYLDMVGCRLNQSELEIIAHDLRLGGHQIVGEPEMADLAIVNTCTVTASAAADSRKMIRHIARAGCPRILPTGCLTTISPDQVENLMHVEKVYPNKEKELIVPNISPVIEEQSEKITRMPLPGKLKRTRAFIKVQDGCDNYCTFCITRIARGTSRSQSKKDIFSDIEYALNGGVKEIVLTGVNLGSWGVDLQDSQRLSHLIREIISKFNPPRIRLSSLEPWDVNDDLLEVIKHPSFCAHLHLPLQSGSDNTLKRMRRRITTTEYKKIVENIRDIKNEIAITTDLIVGFPGETQDDHLKSIEFVKNMHFAGGHVFRYSPRPNTPALKIKPAIPEIIKKDRSKELRKIIEGSQMDYEKKFIGRKVNVLWENSEKTIDGFILGGISENYLNVCSSSKLDLHNKISTVKVKTLTKKHLLGEIVY